MLQIIPIPAFQDNYIWLLHNKRQAIVIDPGDAAPVMQKLVELQLNLTDILITHHHSDHIGGVTKLAANTNAHVYAPRYEQFSFKHQAVSEGDTVSIKSLNMKFLVMWLPGHTSGHVAYLSDGVLFCGDVLFGAGCGRLFEGTPAQMLKSLSRLKNLPRETRIYPAHEYTSQNIEFALTLEPENPALIERQHHTNAIRRQLIPSLPTTLSLELETNPFLRCQQKELIKNSGSIMTDELAVFTTIRELKNNY